MLYRLCCNTAFLLFLALNLCKSLLFQFSCSLCPAVMSYNLIFPLTGSDLTEQPHFTLHSALQFGICLQHSTGRKKKEEKKTLNELIPSGSFSIFLYLPSAFSDSDHSLLKLSSVGSIILFSWKALYYKGYMHGFNIQTQTPSQSTLFTACKQ